MPQIEFINHASVLIRSDAAAVLTDPWYSGPAFHKGWGLLHETPEDEIAALLARVSHIWISHEHPDHFSIGFFKRWGPVLRERGIPVLFQQIDDQRVVQFLRGERLEVIEMPYGQTLRVGDMDLVCLKDEFYDSALSVKAQGVHILNLNDCAVADEARAREIREAVGPCDILLTQFSYAAWKGGHDNRAWREEAAQEKLGNIAVQAHVLEPKQVIPFASFVAFSHTANSYLNDAANTPDDVVAAFQGAAFDLRVMKPGDVTDGTPDPDASQAACDWWRAVYANRPALMTYDTMTPEKLAQAALGWAARIGTNNSTLTMRVFQTLSPIRVFQPIGIRLTDTGAVWRLDPARRTAAPADVPADLSMHSESLWFLMSNSFGFDTLAVNGTFEEARPGGFSRAARSLAIENLNNLGIRFGPLIVFERKLIAAFLERLAKVRAKMRQR